MFFSIHSFPFEFFTISYIRYAGVGVVCGPRDAVYSIVRWNSPVIGLGEYIRF